MNILVVAAHPDDEVLGCGGSMARLSEEGHDVYVCILGEGVTSRYAKGATASNKALKMLHEQGLQVMRMLGAQDLMLYHLPDNQFDTVPLLDVIKIIEKVIEQVRPEVVYTHCGSDLNIDHSVVHRAVITATRPVSGHRVTDIYAFEVPSSTEWSFQQFSPMFGPNVFVDISRTLDKKLKAMELYQGEARPFPHPRSSEALRNLARRWGIVAGIEAAEAFELVRSIRR